MSHPSSPGILARGVLRGLLGASVVLACTAAQAAPASAPARGAATPPPLVVAPVHIHGISYDRARHSLVLTITGPVTISTRVLKAPARLVVDIPSASLDSANRELVIKDDLVTRVRVSQFKIFPPVVRVVIETATEAEPLIAVQQTGKRLYVTLAPARAGEAEPEGVLPSPGPEPSSFTPPTLPEATPTPRPIATARPAAAPTTTPVPTSRPGIQTRLRPGMPIPTPAGRRTPPPTPVATPGGEWRDLFPAPSPTPTRRPMPTPVPARTPSPVPFWTPTPAWTAPPTPVAPIDAEPTPVPPPRGTEETGNETWPSVP